MSVYLPYPHYLREKKRAVEKEKQTGMNITRCVYENEHESFYRFYILVAQQHIAYIYVKAHPLHPSPPPPGAPIHLSQD
jgi:hypothetical protein